MWKILERFRNTWRRKKQSADADDGLPIKLNLIPKVQFCPNDSDVDIVKGYILGALKHIETYNEELRLSNEQKAEHLHALELCCEDLTTREAYQYYLKNR